MHLIYAATKDVHYPVFFHFRSGCKKSKLKSHMMFGLIRNSLGGNPLNDYSY